MLQLWHCFRLLCASSFYPHWNSGSVLIRCVFTIRCNTCSTSATEMPLLNVEEFVLCHSAPCMKVIEIPFYINHCDVSVFIYLLTSTKTSRCDSWPVGLCRIWLDLCVTFGLPPLHSFYVAHFYYTYVRSWNPVLSVRVDCLVLCLMHDVLKVRWSRSSELQSRYPDAQRSTLTDS